MVTISNIVIDLHTPNLELVPSEKPPIFFSKSQLFGWLKKPVPEDVGEQEHYMKTII